MPTVLLVDDSATIRMSVQSVLATNGFDVQVAEGGAQALQLIAAAVPDLIITDLNMPGMDGVAFIHAVRALPHGKFVPVLMLTNESDRGKREEAKAAGATGWMVKPVSAPDLLGVLRQVIPGGVQASDGAVVAD